MIDSMFQAGTDAIGRDLVRRARPELPPEPPGMMAGALEAGPRAVGAGIAKGIAFGAEVAGAFGSVAGAYPEVLGANPLTPEQRRQANEARNRLLKEGPARTTDAGRIFRDRAAELMPDPRTSGAAAQVIAGIGDFLGQVVAGAVVAGPMAPAFVAGATGTAEADKLAREGVDLATRTKAGAIAGAVAGVSTVLPVLGKTTARTVGAVGLAGTANVAGVAAEQTILDRAGYDKLADQYDPFDPVLLALSYGAPAAVAAGIRGYRAVRPMPSVKTEADMRGAAALTPEEQARSDAFERSEGNIKELKAEIARQKDPQAKAVLMAELERLQKPGDSVYVPPTELVDAVRVQQVARAVDSQRLSNDADIPARNAHVAAMEEAHVQMARGERVEVSTIALVDETIGRAKLQQIAERAEELEGPDPWELPPERPSVESLPLVTERADDLRSLARGAGWSQEGGRIIRSGVETAGDEPGGNVVGRTQWIPAEEWFGRMRSELGRGGLTDKKAIERAVEKALAGERLKANEQRTVDWMRQEAEEMRARYRARDLAPDEADAMARDSMEAGLSRFDVEDAALLARAMRINEDAVYALHEAHPRDDAAYLRAVREFVAGAERIDAERPEGGAPARGEEARGAAEETALTSGAADRIAETQPDMLVAMDGSPPMPVSELLDQVRREAADDLKETALVRAAVECLLQHG